MERNLKTLIPNLAASTVLIAIGLLEDNFSVVLLFALAPAFIILKDSIDNSDSAFKYASVIALSLIIGQLIGFITSQRSFDYLLFIYPIGIALFTSIYWLVKKNLNSNLGLMTVIIYWLSFEYFALQINPQFGNYFVFGILAKTPIINFSSATGFLGYTLWGLISNLLLAFVLYDSKAPFKIKFRVLSLIYATVIITAPIWLSLFWNIDGENISRQMMIDVYAGFQVENTDYLKRGEWLGRTSAWVAVLLTIYSLVKKKISK